MPSNSVAATSALTGPGTTAQISASTSWNFFPVLAISEGLVVTPSSSPLAASDLISAVSAVSTKNFMPSLPFAATPGGQAGLRADHIGCRAATESNTLTVTSRRVPVMLPYPFPGPFDYRVPPGIGPSTRRRRAGSAEPARGSGGGLGRAGRCRRAGPQAEAGGRDDRHSADAAGAAPVRRLGGRLHPVAAGRGDGDGAAHRRAGARRRRRPAGGAPIQCPRRGSPRRGARYWTRWPNGSRARTGELARAAGVGAGVVRGMADAGLLVPAVLPIEPPFAIPDPEHPGQVLAPDQEAAAAALRQAVAARDFSVTLLDGVTGSGKTEVVSGGGGGMPAPGPPGTGAAAGDRAVLAVAGALRAPLRRGAGGLAFGPDLAGPPGDLARGGRGRGAGGGRRPVGAVPAVPRPRPGGDRRGARDGVQAGGGRGLPRPRHGGGARAVLLGAGGAGVRHAIAGDAGECRGGPLPPADAADAAWRGGAAGGRGGGHARDAAGAGAFPRPAAGRGGARHAGARRAGDAVPQPPRLCAADAVPALRPPDAVPELHRLAGGAPRATGAAMPPLRPHGADPGGVPGLRRGAQPGAGGAGGGAHHRGGRRAVPRRAPAGDGERHDDRTATPPPPRRMRSRRARWT